MISFESENELELCLFNNQDWMIEKFNLNKNTKFNRQVNIKPYGVIDILATHVYDEDIVAVTIIELKNTNLTLSNMAQVARYMRYFELLQSSLNGKMIDLKGILIGPEVMTGSASDDVFLAQKLYDIDVYSLTIDPMKGIDATKITGWKRTEIGRASCRERV